VKPPSPAKTRVGRYRNAASVLFWDEGLPPGTSVEPLALPTDDRSATTGTLVPNEKPVVAANCLMETLTLVQVTFREELS